MESKDIEQKVNRLEKKQEELEMFVNKSISSIQVGIVDTFADSFIDAARKHEKKVTQFKERVEKEIIRNTAKKSDI